MKDYMAQHLDEAQLTKLLSTGEWLLFIRYLIHDAMVEELCQLITGESVQPRTRQVPLAVFPVGGGGKRMYELYDQEGHFQRWSLKVFPAENIESWMRQDPRQEDLDTFCSQGAASALIVEDLINTGRACLKAVQWLVEHARDLQLKRVTVMAELDLHEHGPLAHIARRWENIAASSRGNILAVDEVIKNALEAQGLDLGRCPVDLSVPRLSYPSRRKRVLQRLQNREEWNASPSVRNFFESLARHEEELGKQLEMALSAQSSLYPIYALWQPGQEFLILDRHEIVGAMWRKWFSR